VDEWLHGRVECGAAWGRMDECIGSRAERLGARVWSPRPPPGQLGMTRRGLIGRVREGNPDWVVAGFLPLCMTELAYWHHRQTAGQVYYPAGFQGATADLAAGRRGYNSGIQGG